MKTRSVFAAIVGKPNTGKSTILNALVGQKIAAVTDKPQTTRTRITGILTQDETQFVFIDTPGLHNPRTKLSEHMVKSVNDAFDGVDAVVLVIEPKGRLKAEENAIIEIMKNSSCGKILVINKIDRDKDKGIIASRIAELSAICEFDCLIPISALKKDGLHILLSELEKFAVEGPHFYPEDAVTDQTQRAIIAEILREKLMYRMQEEIPHGIAVEIESYTEKPGIYDIGAVIYCEKASHKGMVIGKYGANLKEIATKARQDMETHLARKVNLQCWVKVKEDWRNREKFIRELGLS